MEEVSSKNQKRKLEDEKESDSKKQKIEKENGSENSITRLSFEDTYLVIRILAEHVDAGTYFRLSQLCKKTYKDLKIDDDRWKRKYAQFWPYTNPKLQNDSVNWRKLTLQRSALEYPKLTLSSTLQYVTEYEISSQIEEQLEIFKASIYKNKNKGDFFEDFEDIEDLRLLNSVYFLKFYKLDYQGCKKEGWDVNCIIYGPSGVPAYIDSHYFQDWEDGSYGSFNVSFSMRDPICISHNIFEIFIDGRIDKKKLFKQKWNFGNDFFQIFGSTYEDGLKLTYETLKRVLFHSIYFYNPHSFQR